VAGDIEHI